MTYADELEEFAKKHTDTRFMTVGHTAYEAYFWLSAFAKVVREEAAVKGGDNPYLLKEARIGAAFNALCERFGIGK